MIYFISGVPGAGKTLYALNFVKALAEKEGREVYYSGIKDLRLPWINLDDGLKLEGVGAVKGAEDWHKLPPKSIIVIDECQRIFRPRGQGAQVPECVSLLETHRHRGVDLVLISQHSMLMDTNVRRLVGIHFHVVRSFGMKRATIHEFQGIKEQADKSRGDSVRHEFAYPVESFGWYHSAEVHTHKRRIPMRVWFLFVVPVVIGAAMYGVWVKMKPYASPAGAKERVEGIGARPGEGKAGSGMSKPASSRLTRTEWLQEREPRVSDLAYSAPVFDEIVKPVRAPFPAACVRNGSKGCRCYTEQATMVHVSQSMCEDIVERGYFISWDVKPANNSIGAGGPRERAAAPVGDVRVVAPDVVGIPARGGTGVRSP